MYLITSFTVARGEAKNRMDIAAPRDKYLKWLIG